MRLVFALVFLAQIFWQPVLARAEPVRTCNFFFGLISLPSQLDAVRRGRAEAKQFTTNLSRTLQTLQEPSRIAIFTTAEVRAMRLYSGAVREDWQLNGVSPDGRKIPGLTNTSATVRAQLNAMIAKFGCEPPKADGSVPMWTATGTTTKTMSFMALGTVVTILGLGAYAYYCGRQDERIICRLPALMRYSSHCTRTFVVNISRSGALVEIPIMPLPEDKIELHLPGTAIETQLVWSNSNFAGLKFEKRLDSQRLQEILSASNSNVSFEQLIDAPPDCLQKDCHLTCDSHCPTKKVRSV